MFRVPYSSVMSSLMYAMVYSHPDLAYAVSASCKWQNLARNIGKQFSGSCDTCMDPVVFLCSLVGL